MRPENKRMQAFLRANGIEAVPKYIATGSCKRTWRIYGKTGHGQSYENYQRMTGELVQKLNDLGFTNMWGEPIGQYEGNGGLFHVFVRGHNEFLVD